nr:MAG TPA: hypothetical protein [Caudoviricetes sp.]
MYSPLLLPYILVGDKTRGKQIYVKTGQPCLYQNSFSPSFF